MAPTMPTTPSVFTKAPPDQPTQKKPGQLSEEQLHRFFHDGFLILHDIGELTARLRRPQTYTEIGLSLFPRLRD